MTQELRRRPIASYATSSDSWGQQILKRTLELARGGQRLERLYENNRHRLATSDDFWLTVIKELDLNLIFDESKMLTIPANGPLLVVANHPFGFADGLALGHVISLVRNDQKLLAHSVFEKIPETQKHFIPIKFSQGSSALKENIQSMKIAKEHLRSGGCIIIFPAGQVATSKTIFGKVEDAEWKVFCAKLIQLYNPTILPVYFSGQHGWLFQLLVKLGDSWREGMHVGNLVQQLGTDINISIGNPIKSSELGNLSNRAEVMLKLREIVFSLKP